jgi:hypothetical protein
MFFLGAVNTYQWSKARLLKDFSEGSLLVQRFEAASKFFRTFVPALLVLALIDDKGREQPAASQKSQRAMPRRGKRPSARE